MALPEAHGVATPRQSCARRCFTDVFSLREPAELKTTSKSEEAASYAKVVQAWRNVSHRALIGPLRVAGAVRLHIGGRRRGSPLSSKSIKD